MKNCWKNWITSQFGAVNITFSEHINYLVFNHVSFTLSSCEALRGSQRFVHNKNYDKITDLCIVFALLLYRFVMS